MNETDDDTEWHDEAWLHKRIRELEADNTYLRENGPAWLQNQYAALGTRAEKAEAELAELIAPNGIVQDGQTLRGYIKTRGETPTSSWLRAERAEKLLANHRSELRVLAEAHRRAEAEVERLKAILGLVCGEERARKLIEGDEREEVRR